jgi:hypothetical protein
MANSSLSIRLILFSTLYQYSTIALDGVDPVCDEEASADEASFLQVPIKNHHREEGKWDIVFADLPMNFGEDIAKWAAFGADAWQVTFGELAMFAHNGYGNYREEYMIPNFPNNRTLIENLTKLMKPGRPLWGPLNPKLQATGAFNPELPGLKCPLFYTPQKYWPTDVAEEYFGPPGTKEVFANLRNPFEMITAIFRMSHEMTHPPAGHHPIGVVLGYNISLLGYNITEDGQRYSNDGKTCADPDAGLYGDINTWVKYVIPNMTSFKVPHIPVEVGCYLQPQAPFFDGPYGINHPLDMREMPHTATEYLEKHGIDVNPGIKPNDLMHVISCDNTWAGDFDDEAKALVFEYYERDFELACQYFGHCNFTEPICNQHVAGMCPDKVFTWDEAAGTYTRK